MKPNHYRDTWNKYKDHLTMLYTRIDSMDIENLCKSNLRI